jgi:hypothetical protein
MNTSKVILAGLVLVLFGSTLMAEATAPHPCAAVKQACAAAGFAPHEHKMHKGLWKDCFEPLVNGTAPSIAGVTIDPATLQACQAKKAEYKR